MKVIYFLTRGYNDIDCRLPLLFELARDSNYRVIILGIPTNAGMQDPRLHELHELTLNHGIEVITIYEVSGVPIYLRNISKFYLQVNGSTSLKNISPRIHHHLAKFLFYIIRRLSEISNKLIPILLKMFSSNIVITDEIMFHQGRSFFIDALRADWKQNHSFRIYAFLTGQDPYLESLKDMPILSKELLGIPLLVPGPNDARVMSAQLPREEIEIVGNTRFDKSWMALRLSLAGKPLRHIDQTTKAQSDSIKIVFMLSKPEYGVKLDELIKTINRFAAMKKVVVFVKPHTRGMDVNELSHLMGPRVLDGTDYSSSDLIMWSDFIFFTGSSIAFHALLVGKKVVYLKYCQKFRTIFDASEAMMIAESLNDVLVFCSSPSSISDHDKEGISSFLTTHIYNGNKNGLICQQLKKKIDSDTLAKLH